MATGKQGFVRLAAPQHSLSARRGNEMHIQAPLTAMYVQAVPELPSQPQAQPAAVQDAPVVPLSMPMMYANQALPFLTLHIAGGTAVQPQRPETPASSPRPKSAGKHVCPHCGRDCLKPSVLEKHLRCHTGERPYPCATCGISFKTQSNLYKHKRTQAHARLSSESSTSAFSSQESTESTREICSSPSLELQPEDSGEVNSADGILGAVSGTKANALGVHPAEGSTEALCKAAAVAHESKREELTSLVMLPKSGDGHAPLTPNRIPLQRQEALFAKLSRGKTQSHDSTDSGFSESTEHHLTSSLGDSLHNPSLESVASMDLQEPGTSEIGPGDNKSVVSLQEKQKLEEHILKLISENSVLVDDRHLVNVRPRKTVLSKQGSIDLPTRYTYKDSFHFEIGKQQVSGSPKQDRRGRAIYSSMPTQHSTSLEHAPLTRSSSLPFSVGVQNADRTTLPHQVDAVPLSRRCSAGHVYPFSSVDQQIPSHRLLVRQVAVDCLSATEAERGSFGTDGDCADTAAEAAAKRCRRKKVQKFAYNKWYMYGGGTFKKLYNTEQETPKSRKSTHTLEQTESQHRDSNPAVPVSASVPEVCLPPGVNTLTTQTSSPVISSYVLMQNSPAKQSTRPEQSLVNQANDVHTVPTKVTEEAFPEKLLSSMPSERKKQKTEDDLSAVVENPEGLIRQQKCAINASLGQLLQSGCGGVSQSSSVNVLQKTCGSSLNRQGSFTSSSSPNQRLFKRHSSPMFMVSVSGASPVSSISSDSQAKPSFLPKYQLKIPSSTDGTSDSSQKPSEHPKTAPQSHSVTSVTSSGQAQCDTLCTSAISTLNPMTSVTFITQNSNALSKALPQNLIYTSSAISLTPTLVASVPHSVTAPFPNQPLQTFSATADTARTTILPQSHLLGSTKDAQIYTPTTAAVLQNSPATSVLVPRQQQLPASQSSVEALEIRPTAFQGTEDTFYVQTADLQIVMQLISDEQLAMIEPQIEKQAYAPTGSRSALSTTSGAETIQANVSQERHTRTKQCDARGTVNKSAFSEIPGVTPTSVTEHNQNSITSGCGTYLAKGAISSLCPKTENRLGQCKSYFAMDAKVEWSTRSCLKQRPDEDSPADKPINKSGPELMRDQTLRNSTSMLSNMKQCSQDASSTSHTFLASLNKTTASLEASRETHHPVLTPAQQHKSVLVSGTLKSIEGEVKQRGKPQPAPISSASSQEEPLSIGLPCTFSAPPRLTSSESAFTSVVCLRKPLHGANEAFISGQLPQQDSSTQETEAKDLTDRTAHKTRTHFESHRSTSERPQEENVKLQLVSQDSLKGPPVNSSLQSSTLQREGGTGSSWSVPQETKSGGEDAGEGAGIRETTGMGQEEHGMGNKGEMEVETWPNLSQRIITVSTSSAQPDTSSVSISFAPAVCAGTDVGRDSAPLTQSDCACLDTSEHITDPVIPPSDAVVSTLIARSNRPKEKQFPGNHEKFSSPVTCGHLLAHPLLVNAIQKEVEKETQKKNQDRSPSKISERFGVTSHPESCLLRKSTAAHTHASFSDSTHSSDIHPKPACASIMHPTEPNAPVCQWGSGYVEMEERSSSSDDEGKLVIELE